MVLPTTYISAMLLLLAAFLCLGSWANTYRLAGTRWRFELFYFDFAIGALLLSIVAAYTLGTLGSDLAFSDRMLVSGRANQAWVIAGGVVFNLGNMLLVAAISLLGMAVAFPLSIGVALIVSSLFVITGGNVFFIVGGIILMIPALLLDGMASKLREAPAVKSVTSPQARTVSKSTAPKSSAPKRRIRKTTKGLAVAVGGGIFIGCSYPVAAKGMAGEFGLGAYAGMLLFSVGIFISTVMFNFYFMNIAIEGGPITFNTYFSGKPRQHFLGFAGGAICAFGILSAILAGSSPAQIGLSSALGFFLPVASVLLAMGWGATRWKEFGSAPKSARMLLSATAGLFACSLALFGLGVSR